MRTKKIRLGIVMAALSAAMGGTALGAAQTAAVAAQQTGLTHAPSADAAAPSGQTDPIVESTAVYEWL